MEEEELKLDAVVLHELDVVQPVNALFTADFGQRTVGLDAEAVLDEDEAVSHKDIPVLLLEDEGHGVDCH